MADKEARRSLWYALAKSSAWALARPEHLLYVHRRSSWVQEKAQMCDARLQPLRNHDRVSR
jgi:hypothetical protein